MNGVFVFFIIRKDWKKLRNKYLNMQKEKMNQLKKHIVLARKKAELSKQNKQTVITGNCSFSPGLIVKVKLNEPAVEVKDLKVSFIHQYEFHY